MKRTNERTHLPSPFETRLFMHKDFTFPRPNTRKRSRKRPGSERRRSSSPKSSRRTFYASFAHFSSSKNTKIAPRKGSCVCVSKSNTITSPHVKVLTKLFACVYLHFRFVMPHHHSVPLVTRQCARLILFFIGATQTQKMHENLIL